MQYSTLLIKTRHPGLNRASPKQRMGYKPQERTERNYCKPCVVAMFPVAVEKLGYLFACGRAKLEVTKQI